jgi:hypothetical protein
MHYLGGARKGRPTPRSAPPAMPAGASISAAPHREHEE